MSKLDYNALKELIKAVSDSNLTAFEVEENGLSIKMSKEVKVIQSVVDQSNVERTISRVQEEVLCDKKEVVIVEEQKIHTKESSDNNTEVVVSPIVGTYYGAPGPNEKAFVSKGDKVKKGDTLCIVEAMKLMNEISADIDGTIIDIFVENEDMVEYGQPIIKIRKDC